MNARLVGWCHRAQRDGWTPGQKVGDTLPRCGVGTTTGLERKRLPVALEQDPRQRMTRIIGRRNIDHDTAVGIALVARILAHAIGDHPFRLRSRSHHRPAGTHAEAVDSAAIGAVVHQLVIGSTEQGITRKLAIAGLIDQGLRMFNAHTDGKRFGLDINTPVVQHLKRIPCAVTDRKHHMIGCDPLTIGQHHAAHLPLVEFDVVDPTLEADLAAQRGDAGTHVFHHGHQPESADVGLADIKYFGRRTSLDEFGQYLAAKVVRILDLAVKLAVGERAGATFAELHIRLRIEHALAPQTPGVLRAFTHRLAAFQNDRAKAHLGEE